MENVNFTAQVKKLNIEIIFLEIVYSTLQKFRYLYFQYKIYFLFLFIIS